MSWFSFGKTKKELDEMELDTERSYGDVTFVGDEYRNIEREEANNEFSPIDLMYDGEDQENENIREEGEDD